MIKVIQGVYSYICMYFEIPRSAAGAAIAERHCLLFVCIQGIKKHHNIQINIYYWTASHLTKMYFEGCNLLIVAAKADLALNGLKSPKGFPHISLLIHSSCLAMSS